MQRADHPIARIGVERGALLLAGAALLAATALLLLDPEALQVAVGGSGWLAAGTAYLSAHLLRAVRLAYLTATPGVSLRAAAGVHWFSAGLSTLLPFKLGELVRIERVGRLRGDLRDGLAVVWIERAFDAAVFIAAIALVQWSGASTEGLGPVLTLTAVFVFITLLAATVMPGNIRELMLHIVRRGYGRGSVGALRTLRAGLDTIDRVPRVLGRRGPGVALLTVAIWMLELVAIGLALGTIDQPLGDQLRALLLAVTGVALEAVPIDPAANAFIGDLLPGISSDDIEGYRALVVGIPLIGALLALPGMLRRAGARR